MLKLGWGLRRSADGGVLRNMLAVLFGVLAALCWSIHDILARSLAARVGAFRLAALVMVAGGLLLSVYILYDGSIWQSTRSGIIAGLMLGLAYGFGVGGLFKALSLGPISLVGPITAGYPVLAVLWGVANGLEPTMLQWASVAATLVGAVIVARSGTPDGGINAVAPGRLPTLALFCAISMLGYSSSIILGQNAAIAVGEVEATWLSRATALVTILPFMLGEPRPASLTRHHWASIFAMGGLDVLGVIAVNASGHLPGKAFAGIGISTYGALTVVLAMFLLREKVSRGQWAGIAVIAAGVASLSLSQ
jgi:drug/metabolite transporter (DMT)-like permease